MTVRDLVETIVFSRSKLVIRDNNNQVLICSNDGNDSELSKYENYEVMELFCEYNSLVARIWL